MTTDPTDQRLLDQNPADLTDQECSHRDDPGHDHDECLKKVATIRELPDARSPRWRCNQTERCLREDGHEGLHAFAGTTTEGCRNVPIPVQTAVDQLREAEAERDAMRAELDRALEAHGRTVDGVMAAGFQRVADEVTAVDLVAKLQRERQELEQQRDDALAQVASATTLIRELTVEDPCQINDKGGCVTHGYLFLAGRKCPHAEAKELLAAHLLTTERG